MHQKLFVDRANPGLAGCERAIPGPWPFNHIMINPSVKMEGAKKKRNRDERGRGGKGKMGKGERTERNKVPHRDFCLPISSAVCNEMLR